ncbi:MAG: SRPBCC family protein [Alphaproteobacteria bacterium]|nr:SRPBCC family protein [Alphaproteobacteria bacterium]
MATIRKIIDVNAPADKVWAALADFQNVHTRLAPVFLTGSTPDGENARIVSFANGTQAKETLVSADAASRRLVYFIAANERIAHHNASAEVLSEGANRCRFVWTTDVLPDALAPYIDSQMTEGAKAMKAHLERG